MSYDEINELFSIRYDGPDFREELREILAGNLTEQRDEILPGDFGYWKGERSKRRIFVEKGNRIVAVDLNDLLMNRTWIQDFGQDIRHLTDQYIIQGNLKEIINRKEKQFEKAKTI